MKRRRNSELRHQRVALVLSGLLLVFLGVVGLLLATGTIGRFTSWAVADTTLVNTEVEGAVSANEVAYQGGTFAAGVVIFALGAIWLRSQIPARRHHQDQEFDGEKPTGTAGEDGTRDAGSDAGSTEGSEPVAGLNIVRGGALAEALEEDLERHPGVERAVAEVRSEESLIRLRVSAYDSLGLRELRSEIVGPAVVRAATVAELPDVPEVQTDVRFVEHVRTVA